MMSIINVSVNKFCHYQSKSDNRRSPIEWFVGRGPSIDHRSIMWIVTGRSPNRNRGHRSRWLGQSSIPYCITSRVTWPHRTNISRINGQMSTRVRTVDCGMDNDEGVNKLDTGEVMYRQWVTECSRSAKCGNGHQTGSPASSRQKR